MSENKMSENATRINLIHKPLDLSLTVRIGCLFFQLIFIQQLSQHAGLYKISMEI